MRIPSEIRELVERHRRDLERVRPQHRGRLVEIALRLQRQLERQLRALDPSRYTTQEVRVVLAQVRTLVDVLGTQFGVEVGDAIQAVGAEAAGIGRTKLLDEIDVWAKEFRGSVRQISRADLATDLLDEGLLEYYQASRETYGLEAIRKMRTSLATSSIAGETTIEATERLRDDLAMPEWRAERIVRTEQSFASHHRQLEDLKGAYAEDEMGKSLVATFDPRTGEDSKFVHGQVRKLSEPFEDNEGRRYQVPPNRPNDREAMIAVPLIGDPLNARSV